MDCPNPGAKGDFPKADVLPNGEAGDENDFEAPKLDDPNAGALLGFPKGDDEGAAEAGAAPDVLAVIPPVVFGAPASSLAVISAAAATAEYAPPLLLTILQADSDPSLA